MPVEIPRKRLATNAKVLSDDDGREAVSRDLFADRASGSLKACTSLLDT